MVFVPMSKLLMSITDQPERRDQNDGRTSERSSDRLGTSSGRADLYCACQRLAAGARLALVPARSPRMRMCTPSRFARLSLQRRNQSPQARQGLLAARIPGVAVVQPQAVRERAAGGEDRSW